MLLSLDVENLLIVKHARLEFEHGLTVISGETGAGKSLLLDAVSLMSGRRKASAELIGPFKDSCQITAVFTLTDRVRDRLLEAGVLDGDDEEIIIRRRLLKQGKNGLWINDRPVSASLLSDIGADLLRLHAQHEHMALARTEYQKSLLDRFAGIEKEALQYREDRKNLAAVKKQLTDLSSGEQESLTRRDYIKFQLDELEELQPVEGELERLEAEQRVLANGEAWREKADELIYVLENDLNEALARAQKCAEVVDDKELQDIAEQLHMQQEQGNELVYQASAWRDKLSSDPARLFEVDERISAYDAMLRKHGPDETCLFDNWSRLSDEYKELAGLDERKNQLESKIIELDKQNKESGALLKKARASAFKKFAKDVHGLVATLGMPEAKLLLHYQNTTVEFDNEEWHVQTNPGLPGGSLGKVGSGGECARLCLAIAAVVGQVDAMETLIFDEVDSGVGGRLGLAIGQSLASLADMRSVIAVTHTPQIAAMAARHYRVQKVQQSGSTLMQVDEIIGEMRAQEISDMLGGGDAALAQAESLLKVNNT